MTSGGKVKVEPLSRDPSLSPTKTSHKVAAEDAFIMPQCLKTLAPSEIWTETIGTLIDQPVRCTVGTALSAVFQDFPMNLLIGEVSQSFGK